MRRLYNTVFNDHLNQHQQMLFLAGPRQVGKTTCSLDSAIADKHYLNWDNQQHRQVIIAGADNVANQLGLHRLQKTKPLLIFDELHKYKGWRNFLKGFYDTYKADAHIIVTGSAKLDTFRRSGDSLFGRYLLYRLHPLSIRECLTQAVDYNTVQSPIECSKELLFQLLEFGGFPEPFLKQTKFFWRQWQRLRHDLLLKEDIRDLTQIQNLAQLELLVLLVEKQVGQLTSLSSLANKVNVSIPTVKKWLMTLEALYFSFHIRPWSNNLTRSLLKEPKYYLWDWSAVEDQGARYENFVASHLLKATQFWTDLGIGNYELYFIRDKEQNEVDFLITKNSQPWTLIEVKSSHKAPLSKALINYQKKLNVPHAFQVVFDSEYIDADCFEHRKPLILPVQTLLSQLV